MASTVASADALVQASIAALRRGAAREARRLLDERSARYPSAPSPWLLIAQACRMDGDDPAADRAADQLLQREPRHLPALLIKGDIRARAGDDRAASSFYQIALAAAAHGAPPQLAADIQRARAYLDGAQGRYEEHLRAALQRGGAAPEAIGGRFREAIDILCGRAEPFLQQPTAFYYPGLPQIQFYERSGFPWLAALEAGTPDIVRELETALAEGSSGFAPYIEVHENRPRSTNALFDDPSWSALYLWKDGARVERNAARFPAAMDALEHAPLPFIRHRSPMALFSSLRPGTHIAPHTGLLNTRLICHLPLIVPPGCRFRVGNETRAWDTGRTLIFDDSIEHEAWNGGDAIRIVLLFEIWRPELSAEERAALTILFEAINLYGGDAREGGA